MKKTILLAFLGAGLFTANAQTTAATLNVRLYPIQTIELNNTPSNTVNLDYKTAEDYKNGVEVDQVDHLKIYSTGGFFVTVNSTSTTLLSTLSEDEENIAAEDIKITASAGNEPLTNGDYKVVALGTTAQELFSSKTGGIANTVNIKYSTKDNTTLNNYLNKYKNAQNPTVYTTNVVYTIAAR